MIRTAKAAARRAIRDHAGGTNATEGAVVGVRRAGLPSYLLGRFPKLSLRVVVHGGDAGVAARGLARYGTRAEVRGSDIGTSHRAVPDGSLDFALVNCPRADYDLAAVLHSWATKVRPGGAIMGTGYGVRRGRGVPRVVDSLADSLGLGVYRYARGVWAMRIPITSGESESESGA